MNRRFPVSFADGPMIRCYHSGLIFITMMGVLLLLNWLCKNKYYGIETRLFPIRFGLSAGSTQIPEVWFSRELVDSRVVRAFFIFRKCIERQVRQAQRKGIYQIFHCLTYFITLLPAVTNLESIRKIYPKAEILELLPFQVASGSGTGLPCLYI